MAAAAAMDLNTGWFGELDWELLAVANEASVSRVHFVTPPVSAKPFAVRKVALLDVWDQEGEERDKIEQLKCWRVVSDHPFIVPLLAWTAGFKDGERCMFTAMPLICNPQGAQAPTLFSLCSKWLGTMKLPKGTQRGLAGEDRKMRKLWTLQEISAVSWMHSKGVAHQSLHPRNIMIVTDPAHPAEKNVVICDFGKAKWLRVTDEVTQEQVDSWKAKDLRMIAQLYVFATHGFYCYEDPSTLGTREKIVKQQICPATKPATMSDADFEEKRNELGFVLGVLNAPDGKLTADMMAGYPLFQGDLSKIKSGKAHPLFATQLPEGHRLKPSEKSESLWDKYAAGSGKKYAVGSTKKLVMRPEARDVLPYVVAQAHGPCRIYPSLAPLSHACQQAANGSGAVFCPVGTLLDEDSFKKHRHIPNGINDDAAPVDVQLTQGDNHQRALYRKSRTATTRGNRNYLYTKEVKLCSKCGKWVDVEVNMTKSDEQIFRMCCYNKNCTSEPVLWPDFQHLGMIVDTRVTRAVEPWTAFFTRSLERTDPDSTDTAKLLATHNIRWEEPTHAKLRELGADQPEQ
ncbi:hypothetical protein AAVH_21710 [Aphelenchoides avenae]|nr:hypothetical protein AAVH_21710 [Aphelenchus avenae]